MSRPPSKRSAAAAAASMESSCNKRKKVSHDEKFQVMFERLVDYKEEHGDCLVPYRWGPDPQLGKWVNSQRLLHDQEKLAYDRIQQLDEIGFVWRVKQRLLWDEMYGRLVDYKRKHGHCLVPQRYKDDPQLGRWVDTQRENKDRRLTAEHKRRLDEIGFVWSALKESWDEMYSRLVEYKKQHGDCQVTQRYAEDPKLGKWVKNQRLRRDCLSDERIARLEEIGFVWCVQKKQERDTWDSMYKKLCKYKTANGNCLVPIGYKQDARLADWVHTHRQNKGSLTAHQVKRLDAIGFEWTLPPEKSVDELVWDAMFDRLARYKEQHGTCQVLATGQEDLAALSLWVQRQRAAKLFGGITKEQEEKLDSIGFVWKGGQDYLWTRMQEQRAARHNLGTPPYNPRHHSSPSPPWMSGWESSSSLPLSTTRGDLLSARSAYDLASRPPLSAAAAASSMASMRQHPLFTRKTMDNTIFPRASSTAAAAAAASQDLLLYNLMEKQQKREAAAAAAAAAYSPYSSHAAAAVAANNLRKAHELAARYKSSTTNSATLGAAAASANWSKTPEALLKSPSAGRTLLGNGIGRSLDSAHRK